MKRIIALLLALALILGCASVQAEDDKASRYAKGMQLIAQGKYEQAYDVFMGLAGYEDADAKAYALGFTRVATLMKLSDTSAIIEFKGLYGMVDFAANNVTAPQWAETKKLADNRLAVKKGKLWGVIDGTGKVIFSERWYGISVATGTLCTTYDGYFGIVDLSGNGSVVLKNEWNQIGDSYQDGSYYYLYAPEFTNGLIRVKSSNNLWGIAQKDGQMRIPAKYSEISADNNGVCVTRIDRKFGMINLDGRELMACEWVQIGSSTGTSAKKPAFHDGLIRVENSSGLWGYANNEGQVTIAPRFSAAEEFNNGAAVAMTLNSEATIIDPTGTEMYFTNATYFSEQYAADYAKAVSLREQGKYDEAVSVFTALGVYSDSSEQIKATYYVKGEALLAKGEYDSAVTAFTKAGNYSDAATKVKASYYAKGEVLFAKADYDGAVTAFTNAGNYSDATTQIKASYYAKGLALEAKGDKDGAYDAFAAAGDYQDAEARMAANITTRPGDIITFGHYPQTKAGNDNTPIEWLVLDVKDGKALVISKYALDCKPYNTKKTSVTWETCTLRTWLNG